jgi:hypothetical protein
MDQVEQASTVTPVALVALLVMMYFTWSLPRRFAVCPLLAMTCLMPLGQELDLGGLHFHLFRILLLVGVVRVIVKREAAAVQWNKTDKLMLWWVIVAVTLGSLSKPSMELFTNRMGEAYNAVGCYLFIRCVIVDFEDVVTSIITLAFVSMPLAIAMMMERKSGHNPFSIFGGVPEYSALRNGHVRCQGAFRHAILAGTFGATELPLFVALWFYKRSYRLLAAAGTVAAVIIAYDASSSGALMALVAGVAGLCLWKWNTQMRWLRRGVVVLFICLAMVMNAPVWYVFARLSSVTGGDGQQRGDVIDVAVRHFSDWCLVGTTSTAKWGNGEVIEGDQEMMDITNQFVMEGIKGGLLRLILFIAVIVSCFKIVGRRVRAEEKGSPNGFLVWAIGVSLLGHCLSFLSVPYFDQIIVIWYWVLAVCASIACMPLEAEESLDVMDEPDGEGATLAPG